MKPIRQALRLLHINFVLVKHGLDEIIFSTPILRSIRFLFFLLPWNWFRRPQPPRGQRIRLALEELGPIFVKFGQILSTRRDLLPEDIAAELESLQDRVPPFPGADARAIVEQELGHPVDDLFAEFDESPLASASIAQVHAAELFDGRKAVVKVVRPGILATIQSDVELLYLAAGLAERYSKEARRLRAVDVVSEYEATIVDELDLMREAASASQLRRNFEGSTMLKIPEIYWDYSSRNVMVMERVSGIAVNDVESLQAAGVNLQALAETGVEIFFTQVMKHNFFHADMHPGNIFVSAENPQTPQYVAVDFGIMGSLSLEDQRYLAENFLAFFNRDYRRVAELHVASKWVPADTRVNDFEAAIRSVCEPIFDRPLSEISFGRLLLRLFQTARRFNMAVQPQLILLQKTLLNIEGLGRQLYPELDLWQTAKPFLERWMSEQIGPRAFVKEVGQQAPRWAEAVPSIPGLAVDLLRQASTGELRVQSIDPEAASLRQEVRRSNQRTVVAIIGATLFVSATILLGLNSTRLATLWGAPVLTWLFGAIGITMLLRAWYGHDDP